MNSSCCRIRVALGFLGILTLSFLPGCGKTAPSHESPSVLKIASRTVSDNPRIGGLTPPLIQTNLEYRHAAALYEKHNFRAALVIVDTLLAKQNLETVDREYLLRQREICRQSLEGRDGGATQKGGLTILSRPAKTPKQANCGPRALKLICDRLHIRSTVEELTRSAGTSGYGTRLDALEAAAKSKGLKAEGVQMDGKALTKLDKPAIAWVDGDHYLAVLSVSGENATVHDPNKPGEEVIPTDTLLRRSGGILLMISR
jgi:hypothetical protein